MVFDPKCLEGDEILSTRDLETGEHVPVDRGEIYRTISEHQDLIMLLLDIERGLVHMTLEEYMALPRSFMELVGVFREAKAYAMPKARN